MKKHAAKQASLNNLPPAALAECCVLFGRFAPKVSGRYLAARLVCLCLRRKQLQAKNIMFRSFLFHPAACDEIDSDKK